MHNKIKLDYVSAVTNIVCCSEEGSPFQDWYALVYFFFPVAYENEGCYCV